MNIVIAPDSFKGSLSAVEVASRIAIGLKKAWPQCHVIELPVADGGDGSTDALVHALGGNKVHLNVQDPLGRSIEAFYGLVHQGKVAIIETAQASGLTRLKPEEQNPLNTSSYGTGQLIQHALDQHVEEIWVCLGGSATVDGGLGMATALGLKAMDQHERQVSATGQGLIDLVKIDVTEMDPRLSQVMFKSLYDVDNVLTGPKGAQLFMSQKGATQEVMVQLDIALKKWGKLLQQHFQKDVINLPSAGAAGGMGAATVAFFNAEPVSGIGFILHQMEFDKHLETAQLVISGEGRVDEQTVHGKVIAGIAQHTNANKVPLLVMCGAKVEPLDELYEAGVSAVYAILPKPVTEAEAFKHAADWLESAAFNLGKTLLIQTV